MSKKLGHKDIEIKRLKKRIRQLEKAYGAEPTDEYKDKVYHNSWHDDVEKEIFPVVSEVLAKVRQGKWSWTRNWSCKYIDIRIDMRDGGAVLCNRETRISPEQLKYQVVFDHENKKGGE